MEVKGVTETIGADSNIAEINAIVKRVENKANQIDEAFNRINASPETVPLDPHLLTGGRVGIPKDTEMLIEELELFFAQATGELLILSRKQIQYVLENNKQARGDIVQGISKSLTAIRSQKEAGEQLLTDLAALEKKVVTSQRTVDAEVDALLQRMQEPIADMQLVYDEYERILRLLSNFHKQTGEDLKHLNQMLEPLREKIRIRRQRKQVTASVIVLLISVAIYLQWSLPQGMFQPQLNAVFAFVISGIVLTFITFTATVKLVVFEDDHTALFTVIHSPFLNKLLMYGITLIVLFLLIVFNYIIILHYLYLLLYALFNYLDTINKVLTWIVNISTIVSVAFIVAGKVKQIDLRRSVQHLFSLLSGR